MNPLSSYRPVVGSLVCHNAHIGVNSVLAQVNMANRCSGEVQQLPQRGLQDNVQRLG